jgi:hypothetical protein
MFAVIVETLASRLICDQRGCHCRAAKTRNYNREGCASHREGSYHFLVAVWRAKETDSQCVKDWEIIAGDLKRAGWSYGYISAVDRDGRTIWIADAHRGDGKRFIVRADEKLTAFLELESTTAAVERPA